MIYWSDETAVDNQDQTGRGWSPKGQTPVVTRNARRFGGGMISGVSNRGLMRFMLYDGALNADLFLTFLRRLIKDARQKVFLIVDKLRVHHARKVKAWVAARTEAIELFYLPGPCARAPGLYSTSTAPGRTCDAGDGYLPRTVVEQAAPSPRWPHLLRDPPPDTAASLCLLAR